MIKQNHYPSVTAVTTLFVVLLGCGMANAKEKPHNRVRDTYIAGHNIRVSHEEPGNVKRRKQRKNKGSKPGTIDANGYKAVGLASWYGYESGNRTALGTKFNPLGLSAAHRSLPLPTQVKVTNLKNHKSVVVTVNDRGPYIKGRLIDLSLGAARAIGMTGVGKVEIEVL